MPDASSESRPADDECRLVVAEPGARRAGAPGRTRGAELVGAEDPAEDDADALPAEGLAVIATVGGTVATQSSP